MLVVQDWDMNAKNVFVFFKKNGQKMIDSRINILIEIKLFKFI